MLRHVARPLLENAGRHEEWGTETARSLIRLEAGHDKNHVAQIQRILDGIAAMSTFTPSAQKPEIPIDVIDTRAG